MRKTVFIIITVIFLWMAWVWLDNQPIKKEFFSQFDSQEICEEQTGVKCIVKYSMCDFVPAGKTIGDVCGKNFKKIAWGVSLDFYTTTFLRLKSVIGWH